MLLCLKKCSGVFRKRHAPSAGKYAISKIFFPVVITKKRLSPFSSHCRPNERIRYRRPRQMKVSGLICPPALKRASTPIASFIILPQSLLALKQAPQWPNVPCSELDHPTRYTVQTIRLVGCMLRSRLSQPVSPSFPQKVRQSPSQRHLHQPPSLGRPPLPSPAMSLD